MNHSKLLPLCLFFLGCRTQGTDPQTFTEASLRSWHDYVESALPTKMTKFEEYKSVKQVIEHGKALKFLMANDVQRLSKDGWEHDFLLQKRNVAHGVLLRILSNGPNNKPEN